MILDRIKKISIVALVLTFSCNLAAAEEFTFNYNPPDGLTYDLTEKTTKIKYVNGKKERTDKIELTTRVEIHKDGNGYVIEKNPVKLNSKRDGETFVNTLYAFLNQIPTRSLINSNGALTEVYGYENIVAKAKKKMPQRAVDAIRFTANPEAMSKKTKAEWNAKIAAFAGQTVKIGDAFTGSGIFPIPNGERLTFFSVVKIADTVRKNGEKLVKITYKNSSNPDSIAAFMNSTVEDIKSMFNFDANDDLTTNISLDGGGERLIDPDTMLIYSEKSERVVEIESEVIGEKSKTNKTVERKEYIYDYKE